MQPMNYTLQTGGANTPANAFTQGASQTATLMATAADYQKAQQMATAQQMANELAAQKRADFSAAAEAPTYENVQKLSIKYPEVAEQFKHSLDSLDARRKEALLSNAFSAATALEGGNVDAAKSLIDRNIKAAEASNSQDELQRLNTLKDVLTVDPKMALLTLHGTLFGGMGGDKYAEARAKLGKEARDEALQPALVEKGKAEASETASKAVTAAAKAKFAESDAAIDLQKKGWDITKIQEDIKINKMNSQIAAMNAQTSRMSAGTAAQGNSLKAQENQIKLADLIDKRNTAVREKAADATASLATIDTSRALINEILGDEDTLRAASGVSAFRGMIPGTKSRAMAGKVDQLANSIASTKLELLKGATSDKDIQFLKTIDSNLDRYQNEDALVKEVKRIDKGLLEFRKRQADRYGVPNNAPISSSEPSSGKNTDAILKELGVIK